MKGDGEKRNRGPVLRVGVSSCLSGEEVRYNGGHTLDRYLVGTLGCFVEWTPVCPEVEMGLPLPRETLRLVGDPEAPRLMAPKSGRDYTEQMQAWAQGRAEELAAARLHGFVFKKNSPSSGLFRVRVYADSDMPRRVGTGMFPRGITKRFPLLPVEEEGRLHDMGLWEYFIERIFAYYRGTEMLDQELTASDPVKFHSAIS